VVNQQFFQAPAIIAIQFRNQLVAQVSRLCRRRLKPAATINCFLIATRYQVYGRNANQGFFKFKKIH
jgi:hypothetical protein